MRPRIMPSTEWLGDIQIWYYRALAGSGTYIYGITGHWLAGGNTDMVLLGIGWLGEIQIWYYWALAGLLNADDSSMTA
jgi:hypothetical protein